MGGAGRLRVVVVDGSPTARRGLRAALDSDPALEVVGEARSCAEALPLVRRLTPSVVLLDLDLPERSALAVVEQVMAVAPTPIVGRSADGADGALARAALAAGAVDVLDAADPDDGAAWPAYAATLRQRVRLAGRVKVITHPRGRLRSEPAPAGASLAPSAADPLAAPLAAPPLAAPPLAPAAVVDPYAPVEPSARSGADPVQLVVIGASTGGPQALAALLRHLPRDFTPPVLVVQHMAAGFVEGMAEWLDGVCRIPVAVARTGRLLRPGTVTVAPSGRNLLVSEQLRVTLAAPRPGQFHVPGVDETFGSVADAVAGRVVGVLLTGMGRDGAEGLRALRDRGAFTIAQDESTSAVYGMPAAAMELDAVDLQLPLEAIGPALLDAVHSGAMGARDVAAVRS